MMKKQRTKSGRTVPVLYLDVEDLEAREGEARAYEAAELARADGCAHWRIVDDGQLIQHGTAASPLLTREQAAARSGPAEERHDW